MGCSALYLLNPSSTHSLSSYFFPITSLTSMDIQASYSTNTLERYRRIFFSLGLILMLGWMSSMRRSRAFSLLKTVLMCIISLQLSFISLVYVPCSFSIFLMYSSLAWFSETFTISASLSSSIIIASFRAIIIIRNCPAVGQQQTKLFLLTITLGLRDYCPALMVGLCCRLKLHPTFLYCPYRFMPYRTKQPFICWLSKVVNNFNPFLFLMSLENTDQPSSRLCTSCNSFFGAQACDWMCSSCFKNTKKQVKRKESAMTNISEKVETAQLEPELPKEQIPCVDKTRCFRCNKRVGLLGVECKCTMVFCNLHRMPQSHQCGIDYRKLGKQKLSKEQQVVAPSKITEI